MPFWSLFSTTFLIFIMMADAMAETVVVVGRERGQAFLTTHRGLCYAILPSHVARQGRAGLTFESALPVRRGNTDRILADFPKGFEARNGGKEVGMDLALQTVKGPLSRSCGPQWSTLPLSLDQELARQPRGEIVAAYRNQALQRVPVIVTRVTYETLRAVPANENDLIKIGKGVSGALFTIDGLPTGIVLQGPSDENEQSIGILRMDAIVARLKRRVESLEILPAFEDSKSRGDGYESLAFQVVDWNVTPLEASHNPTNLADPNDPTPFVSEPPITKVKLELKIEGEHAAVLRKVRIDTDVSDPLSSAPKSIEIGVESAAGSPRRLPRRFGTADMSPNGVFSVEHGSGTYARHVFVTVTSLWSPGKPLRIDSITLIGQAGSPQ